MRMDISFHYPPDLLSLLNEAIPKLSKSKKDLILFFQGAGVSDNLLSPYRELLGNDKASFNKYHVSRELLAKLNELGERTLKERREILKRVTEFHDFSVCWQSDQAPARGLVAQIREVVNVKDSFTRINIEREKERKSAQVERDARLTAEKARKTRISSVRSQLFALFGDQDPHRRGKALEGVLNSLFEASGILVREAFTVKGNSGEGVVEQIDGLVEDEGNLYLVELKWWKDALGTADISPHIVRVYNRGTQVRGLFISYSEFTGPAIATCRDALAGGAVIILSQLQEIVELLNTEGDLKKWLKAKTVAAIIDKNPNARIPLDLTN
ncbi:restriction endonuclease [Luteolibacter sp. Populi]|uniref:restriction endonuclease n=1 Tax=Luteolibacter sp. Populi TaxID=3230487 RepID=UPI00346680CC